VSSEAVELLEDHLQIPPTLLRHVNSDADIFLAGSSILLAQDGNGDHQQVPQQLCMSFGAPLVHADDPMQNHDVARLRVHLILINRTVITFTKVGGIAHGIFSSPSFQRHSHLKKMFQDHTGVRAKVLDMVDKDSGRYAQKYGPDAWFLCTAFLWAVQQELFEPVAVGASTIIDDTWARCQHHVAATYSYEVMCLCYILQQRAVAILVLGNSFKEAIERLTDQGKHFSPERLGHLVRADLESTHLACKNTVREFESHVEIMKTVLEMWKGRQELSHTQVNTTLAMVATIFLPLTFLCGVYGMNFNTHDGTVAIPLLRVGNGFTGYMAFWGISTGFMVVIMTGFIRMRWFTLVGLSMRNAMRTIVGCVVFVLCLVAADLAMWGSNVDNVRGST